MRGGHHTLCHAIGFALRGIIHIVHAEPCFHSPQHALITKRLLQRPHLIERVLWR
jgi:hypothetical protein